MPRALALVLCRIVVRVSAFFVPATARQRWRREWAAEFSNWSRDAHGVERSTVRLLKRGLIAFRDAFDARAQERARLTGQTWVAVTEPTGSPRRSHPLEDLLRDVRFGVRSLFKQAGFTVVAVVTIALGIAANTTIFSLVNGILVQPLAYDEPDRIVVVWPDMYYSQRMFEMFESASTSYESLAIFGTRRVIELSDDGARRLLGPSGSANFFDVLGAEPFLGRTFSQGDDRPGADDIIVISHGLWQRQYESDRNVVGRRLRTSDGDRTIVGVMPSQFSFPWFGEGGEPDVAIPQRIDPAAAIYGSQDWKLIGRLAPGVTPAAAQAELRSINDAWRQELSLPDDWAAGSTVVTLKEFLVGDVRPMLLLLFGAVGFILLIATANVANLLLVRALAREREVSLRLALGARSSRLVRQFLTESTLLGLLGVVPGAAASMLGLQAVLALLPAETPRIGEVRIDLVVLGFSVAVALVTGWLAGLVPALQLVRTDLRGGLGSGSRSATDTRGRRYIRSGIVVAQVALTVMLLAGAGLLLKSFWRLQQVDTGFQAEGLVKFDVTPEGDRVTADSVEAYFDLIEMELEAIPGVRAASTIWKAPLGPDGGNTGMWLADAAPPAPGDQVLGRYRPVGEDYFDTAGIPLIEGRGFTRADAAGGQNVAILSRAAAQDLFPDADALGKRILVDMPNEEMSTVVGVVGDVRINGPASESPAIVYRPYPQSVPVVAAFGAWGRAVVLRTDGDPPGLAEQVRVGVRDIDANALISDYAAVPSAVSASLTGRRVTMILLAVFTAVALVLAAVGVYGLMAYSVRSRSRELSIRAALGASGSNVASQVFRSALRTAALGAAVGVALALALSRVVETFVFEVSTTDPWVLGAAAGGAMVTALLASLAPALRAVRADPVDALTAE